ncbi:MAG: YiiX/YebB-like N1pC/P60 family cysteine hydrolase [Ginsengibacter sp.]
MRIPFSIFIILFFAACGQNDIQTTTKLLSASQKTALRIDSLKQIAKDGDLIVRLTDDLVSEQVKLINEKDKSYSHAGIIFKINDTLKVYNISPDSADKDEIKLEPLDSFINPAKNISCALYRYTLSGKEIQSLKNTLDSFKSKNVTFDWQYNLATDDKMYCAELIDKSLAIATKNRVTINQTYIPVNMRRLVYHFFKKEKVPDKVIDERKIITIDNLYLRPDCQRLMSFQLKQFPGNE